MNETLTLLKIAARHLAECLIRIADGAGALITTAHTFTPRHVRATTHIARILELCALLSFRLATNPGYLPPLPPEGDDDEDEDEDDAPDASDAPENQDAANAADTPEQPEKPERPEALDRLDSPPPGARRSTGALVREIQLELERAAIALGHPLPKELQDLCNQAICAAMQLEHISLMALMDELDPAPTPTTNPPTYPQPPAPKPTTTLEL